MKITAQKIETTSNNLFGYLNALAIALLVIFSSLMTLSFLWNTHIERKQAVEYASHEARAIIEKDQAYRHWAISHGDVYVPVTDTMQPNPYLSNIFERDIETASGRHLTLLNPATIMKQTMQQFHQLYGVQGHITSLNLLNKLNIADTWERQALIDFSNGVKEKITVVGMGTEQHLRMMKPLITVEACLKCHSRQNYKLGDIRGGIAISLPLAPHLAIERKNIQAITLSHSFIWFLGVVGIGAAYGKGRSVILERVDAENARIDITAALMASENKYRLILNSTGEGIFGVDMDGNCTFANPACVKFLGYPSDKELLGKNMHQVSHHTSVDGTPYPLEGCRIHQSLHSIAGSPRTEEIFWRADGSSFPTEYCSYPQIVNQEIVGAVVAFTDISQRKELERQKSTLHEQLLHSQKMEAIGLLAGGIAHDFNNILTIIHGFGSMIQMEVAENDKLLHEVDQILAAADRAAQLTRSLLLFSRKQITELKTVDLNVIAQGSQSFLSRIIGEDISIRTELWAEKLLIHADIGQIEQVLMNLATNARDAMPNGGKIDIKTKTAEIDEQFLWEHGFGKVGRYALVSVADNGSGMDHETSQKIFEPFYTTKEAGKGTGLGLTTVYGIVKQHQGYINVESLPGHGTKFKIYLPIIEHEVQAEVPPGQTYAAGGNEMILVAEDDEMTRELLTNTLSSFGYTVLNAIDGDEAVQLFNEHRDEIKLLLMDITMPNKSGAQAYEDILKIDPKMKTIFMTGYPVDMYENDQLKYDGCELIKKPIFITDLTRRIREMLDSGSP